MSDGEIGPNQMACNELVAPVTDYLEDRLPGPDVKRLEAHLSICGGCRNHVDQMRETIDALGRLPEARLDPRGARGAARGVPRLAGHLAT
jgi:anti-sigma factor RsiW